MMTLGIPTYFVPICPSSRRRPRPEARGVSSAHGPHHLECRPTLGHEKLAHPYISTCSRGSPTLNRKA